VKYLAYKLFLRRLQMGSARTAKSLPLKVAAVCYRRRGNGLEFLLVNTRGGNKWTFPKGSTDPKLSHCQAAEREAAEEAGALGKIDARHFHLYLYSKGVFWQPEGVQEFVVKAFLMEVHQMRRPDETNRKPTWLSPEEAKRRLAKGREVKYFRELEAVIDRALERINFHHELWGAYPGPRNGRSAKDPIATAVWP
jgi:8-oxo-dGTP pyrophosphatase MutT (NUDIX family)